MIILKKIKLTFYVLNYLPIREVVSKIQIRKLYSAIFCGVKGEAINYLLVARGFEHPNTLINLIMLEAHAVIR